MAQFYKTPEFKKVIEDVNERLHFKDEDFSAKKTRVMNMYDLCRFEGIWTKDAKSVWCSVSRNYFSLKCSQIQLKH